LPCKAFETVETDRPSSRAMSLIVSAFNFM
jgi:hypothetical protein